MAVQMLTGDAAAAVVKALNSKQRNAGVVVAPDKG